MFKNIKFRAWDLQEQKMKDIDVIYFYDKPDEFGSVGEISYPNMGSTRYFGEGQYVQCIPMQFTGLRDKNGKEIYEGDIIEFGGSIHEIEFSRGCFYMKYFEGGDTVPWLLDIKYHENSKVLGNIHDNPELLK